MPRDQIPFHRAMDHLRGRLDHVVPGLFDPDADLAPIVALGVHAPEFAFEKNVKNVRAAVADLKIGYPVAIENDYAIWRAFNNQYWPAHYFIDAQGNIRHHHFGEGDYEDSEHTIQQLLAEAGRTGVAADVVAVKASGAEAASDMSNVGSPETYVGYERAENFISPGGAVEDMRHVYTAEAPRLRTSRPISATIMVAAVAA
jgi:hypothetical protein